MVHFRVLVDLDGRCRGDLHGGEGGMVGGDRGEVVLQHGEGAGQRHVTTAAEQSHTAEAEDGGHQRGVGHPPQTLDAALEASYRGGQRAGSGVSPGFRSDLRRCHTQRMACWGCIQRAGSSVWAAANHSTIQSER